jgi:hypothetical protein
MEGWEQFGPLPPIHTYEHHRSVPEPSETELYDIVNRIQSRKRVLARSERREKATRARMYYEWSEDGRQVVYDPRIKETR